MGKEGLWVVVQVGSGVSAVCVSEGDEGFRRNQISLGTDFLAAGDLSLRLRA